MKNNRLLQILQKTVSEDEIGKLSAHTLPHISDFNRSVILKMLQDKLLAQEEISEGNIWLFKPVCFLLIHSFTFFLVINNSANRKLLIRIALKATIILTFPKYTPVMLVQG